MKFEGSREARIEGAKHPRELRTKPELMVNSEGEARASSEALTEGEARVAKPCPSESVFVGVTVPIPYRTYRTVPYLYRTVRNYKDLCLAWSPSS